MGERSPAEAHAADRSFLARRGNRRARSAQCGPPARRQNQSRERRIPGGLVRAREGAHLLLPERPGGRASLVSRSCDGHQSLEYLRGPVRVARDPGCEGARPGTARRQIRDSAGDIRSGRAPRWPVELPGRRRSQTSLGAGGVRRAAARERQGVPVRGGRTAQIPFARAERRQRPLLPIVVPAGHRSVPDRRRSRAAARAGRRQIRAIGAGGARRSHRRFRRASRYAGQCSPAMPSISWNFG